MRTARKRVTALLAAGALAAGLAGCAAGTPGAAGTGSNSSAGASETPTLSGAITVYAAASLKSTFTKLASDFEAKSPGTKITLNFAGSSDLVTQITQGAPADVFASADTKNMTKLNDAELIDGAPANFATNVLEIAVPPSNPASISSFADLARPGVKVVVCAPQVPCGAAAETVEKPPAPPWRRSARNRPSRMSWARSPRVRPTPGWSMSRTSGTPEIRSKASPSPSRTRP